MFDQLGEAVRQDVTRDAQLAEEFLEMVQAVETGAQDHEGPSLAHDLQRLRQAAFGQFTQRFANVTHKFSPLPTTYLPQIQRLPNF